jgi:hypothetical protein
MRKPWQAFRKLTFGVEKAKIKKAPQASKNAGG